MEMNLLKKEDFEMSFYEANDTPAERFTFEANGHVVQAIRVDGENDRIIVYVDEDLHELSPEESEAFARKFLD